MAIQYVETSKLPTPWGMFAMHGFLDTADSKEHIALTMGELADEAPALVRVHSECLTGDALFSLRCDCGAQLQAAMQKIALEGRGAIIYLRQEGRGIGLLNKIKAYHLQDKGADTVEANVSLGFGPDMRDYSILSPILEHLGIRSLRLLTNNPRKIKAIQEMGIHISERIPHDPGRNTHNEHYLNTKQGKLGHLLGDDHSS